MLKQLMIATAVSALMASTALAQSPTTTTTTGGATASSAKFVTQQTADQWLASKFKGTDVMGPNNEKVGDVSDVLFDKSGRVLAYVVGVGGFLGIGQKDVAIQPTAFDIIPPTNSATANDRSNLKLKLSMTKDELKAAPDFVAYKETAPAATVGAGGSAGMNRPAGTVTPAPTPATPPATNR